MTKAQELLKSEVELINDEEVIEKVRIFILGILTQQGIEQKSRSNYM